MEATRRTRRALILLAPVLVVAVVAGVISFSSRGDAAFVFDQQHPPVVDSRELEALVGKAPEPTTTGAPGGPSSEVRCTPGSARGERNPWRCVVRYASGTTRRYEVTVRGNGAYSGETPTGRFAINGCCVATPAAG